MSESKDKYELLKKDPGAFIRKNIEEYTEKDPANRLSFVNNYIMWDKPLVRYADGDDPIFNEYKKVIGPESLTPREALAKSYKVETSELPDKISVISWILPTAEGARVSNRKETKLPSRLWSHTRWYGEKFNNLLREHVVETLRSFSFLAIAPFIEPYFGIFADDKGPYSNWSERHVAFAAGHGTFSLSDGFITERGIAHRCGSVITSLVLPVDKRKAVSPYSNCLYYVDKSCMACAERCPAGAISEQGHDKIKCQTYLRGIGYISDTATYYNDTSVAGCGLCQTKVPCEFTNPVKT